MPSNRRDRPVWQALDGRHVAYRSRGRPPWRACLHRRGESGKPRASSRPAPRRPRPAMPRIDAVSPGESPFIPPLPVLVSSWILHARVADRPRNRRIPTHFRPQRHGCYVITLQPIWNPAGSHLAGPTREAARMPGGIRAASSLGHRGKRSAFARHPGKSADKRAARPQPPPPRRTQRVIP